MGQGVKGAVYSWICGDNLCSSPPFPFNVEKSVTTKMVYLRSEFLRSRGKITKKHLTRIQTFCKILYVERFWRSRVAILSLIIRPCCEGVQGRLGCFPEVIRTHPEHPRLTVLELNVDPLEWICQMKQSQHVLTPWYCSRPQRVLSSYLWLGPCLSSPRPKKAMKSHEWPEHLHYRCYYLS